MIRKCINDKNIKILNLYDFTYSFINSIILFLSYVFNNQYNTKGIHFNQYL